MMSEGCSVSCNLWKSVAVAVVISLVARHAQLKYNSSSSKLSRKLPLPSNVTWIGQGGYDVLVAICDTLLPSLTLQECSDDEIRKAFSSMGVDSIDEDLGVSLSNLAHAKAYLAAGAVELRTPEHAVLAVQQLISQPDQLQLAMVLTAMSTSIGGLALTGYPVPFTSLSRTQREGVLRSFSNSSFETFRGLFAVSCFLRPGYETF